MDEIKRILFAIVILFFTTEVICAQTIFVSKDSLCLFQTEDNYDLVDTLFITNTGDADLIIDSIKTEHGYSYQVEINSADTTIQINLINYEKIGTIKLRHDDSIRVIFSRPDLCPVCSSPSGYLPFTDSATFYSNALNIQEYLIKIIGDGYTSINREEDLVDNFNLSQNYPNPFNPNTTISYTIPVNTKSEMSNVKLIVYDVLGREVVTLVNKSQNSGSYEVAFDAGQLNSGVYFYQLQYDAFTESKKMILLK